MKKKCASEQFNQSAMILLAEKLRRMIRDPDRRLKSPGMDAELSVCVLKAAAANSLANRIQFALGTELANRAFDEWRVRNL